MRGGLLVVVAHPDDETFGCGSLLAHAVARGRPAAIVCATRGEAGSIRPGSGIEPAQLAEAREAELRHAAEHLGVGRVELLGWGDSGMQGAAPPNALVDAPVEAVAAEIARLIDQIQPDVVVTLDGSDGHRDHAHVRDATLHAIDHTGWEVPRVYLHCLPQELMQQWRDELVARQPDSDHLAIGELGTPQSEITTVLDTAQHLEAREAAIALHTSQVSPFEAMPATLRRKFLTVDWLRRVRPAWTGGAAEHDIFDTTAA